MSYFLVTSLFTCLMAIFIRKFIRKIKVTRASSSRSKKKICSKKQENLFLEINSAQYASVLPPNQNCETQIGHKNKESNVTNCNAESNIDPENRLFSFGGSVGCKMSISDGTAHSKALNLEMQMFADEILQLITSNPPMFDDWYHRKSSSIVLAVCQWKPTPTEFGTDDCDSFIYTRGINVEVSLPTGSICAERIAISGAHTCFPSMKGRHRLCAVAVLEMSRDERNPLLPCGVCQMWLEKLASPNFRVIAYPDRKLNHFIEFDRPWSM